MYCNYYGFSEKPFNVTPDPRFLYLTPDHRETLASIAYGIQERRGFITVIGEVGTGKTTLLNAAVDLMDDRTRVAFIFNTDVTFNEMLNMALYEWGVTKDNERLPKADAIQRLKRFALDQLKDGGNMVLIVDEAQHLDHRVIENLRLLSNLETRRHKLIQIVLSGQPEFDTKLKQHELRQLSQRISIKRYVSSLDEKSTYAYLQHRLKIVQDTDAFPFTPEAQKLIWEYSKGVPRKINILCDNAFLIGYALKMKKINKSVMLEAAQDQKWLRSSEEKKPWTVPFPENSCFTWVDTQPPRRSFKLPTTIVLGGILVLAGSLFLNSNAFNPAKPTHFFSNIKGTVLKTVHSEPAKKQVVASRPDIFVNAVTEPEKKPQKTTKENPEPETLAENKDIYHLTLSNYHLVKEKKSGIIVQEDDTQNPNQLRSFNKIDPSEPPTGDHGKHDLSVSETRTDDKEKTELSHPAQANRSVLKVKIRKGDTLFRIISQKFGGYNGTILAKVLRKNPGITDPNKILAGQEIKLPADNARDRI
jgi:general secretion pathway protein A